MPTNLWPDSQNGLFGGNRVSLFWENRIGLPALVQCSAPAAAVSPLLAVRFAHFHLSLLLSILLVFAFAFHSIYPWQLLGLVCCKSNLDQVKQREP